MSVLMYMAGLALVGAIGKKVWDSFYKKNGTKIQYQVYHKINENIVLESPTLFNGTNYIDEHGVERYRLSKSHKFVEMEGLDPGLYINNTKGVPFVKIIKIGEGAYKVMEERYNQSNKIEYDVIDRDVSFWGYNEKEKNRINHKIEDKWEWLKKSAVLMIAVLGCIILFYMTFNKIDDMQRQAHGEVTANIQETLNTVKSYLEIVKTDVVTSDNIGKTETTAPKPVGQQKATS